MQYKCVRLTIEILNLNKYRQLTIVIICCLTIIACTTLSAPQEIKNRLITPKNWQSSTHSEAVKDNWVSSFDSAQLLDFVNSAIENNLMLKQQEQDVQIKKQQLIIAGSGMWPNSDLSITQSRGLPIRGAKVTNNASIELSLSYEVDLWGKLSAAEQQSHYDFLASQSRFEYQKLQLAANTSLAWIKVIEEKQHLRVLNSRLKATAENLSNIESGYRRGIISSLDVYLARNELNSERAGVSAQQTAITKSIRNLERILGKYPTGILTTATEFPDLPTPTSNGLPSDLIDRHPELVSSWSNLLARNAALAFAHRQRLPSLNLSATLTDKGELASNLLSGKTLGWSLLASITSPIFDAGKLKANEEVARLQLKQSEYGFLDVVYTTFNAVENALTQEQSLQTQLSDIQFAEQNAQLSAKLAFEQYQKGLTPYITVILAQRQYFQAKTSTTKTYSQLLSNRVQLHLALGGNFALDKFPEGQ